VTLRNDPRWLARGEHPRPQLQRARWRSLDGTWQFAYDDEARWSEPRQVEFDRDIRVPYPPESTASGVGDPRFHPVCWYRRRVELTPQDLGDRVLLHFGAVDYHAKVWANGQLVVTHQGGHTPFTADLTEAIGGGSALELVVRAFDDPHDLEQPRGKQDWLEQPHEIWVVKLADRITNLAPPPSDWTREKCRAYRDEALEIVGALGAASGRLEGRIRARIVAYAAFI